MLWFAVPRYRARMRLALWIVWILSPFVACGIPATQVLRSPDGRIQVAVHAPKAGSDDLPQWDVSVAGQRRLEGSRLDLATRDHGHLLSGAALVGVSYRNADTRIPWPFGRADHVRDRHREMSLQFSPRSGPPVEVIVRCHEDAVSIRYHLEGQGTVVIEDERTSFRVVGRPKAMVQFLENFRTSHEHPVETLDWDRIPVGRLVDVPLTLLWSDGTSGAITEAALRRYPGMSLMRPAQSGEGVELVSQLTPRPDGTKAVRSLPMDTPWRVILLADRPGRLLESGTLFSLNDPPASDDFRWIRPGKITFHWWNGDVFDGLPGDPILSVPMARRYIDFCASNHITAHAMSSTEVTTTPWYRQSKPGVEPGPDTDVTRPREGFDLAAIRAYAESKGVRLWTWVHHAALRGRVEEAFAAFERLGWSGMMVDFFDHDDQETVEFAESILEAAARHHILVHLHGVWKPTGLERTYPNLMNHEGALNLEYLKWSDRCTPGHDVDMAFTRLIAGPMDYHLGGFRAVPRDRFRPRSVAPEVLGTRCHMLAMYVCFDNPTPMVADYPTAYLGQPGFEFLQRVPTYWDKTQVPVAIPDSHLVSVRRKGRAWFLGGLSSGPSQSIVLPLNFLPRGPHRLRLWSDNPTPGADPNDLRVAESLVTRSGVLEVDVAQDGGFVAELVPLR